MTNSANKTFTNTYIKYPNGHTELIYKQMTKKGLRYYRYFRGRFFIVSKQDVETMSHPIEN